MVGAQQWDLIGFCEKLKGKMARKPYPTDLSDPQWDFIRPDVPETKEGGRPAVHERREIVNAILYLLDGGIKWRSMPHDLPPWQTVYAYFKEWEAAGVWRRIKERLVERERLAAGREASPSIALIDSQSVKAQGPGEQIGYDAAKKVKGRKRHIVVDTLGIVLAVMVTAACVSDRDAAEQLLDQELSDKYPRLSVVRADSGYSGQQVERAAAQIGCELEVIKRPKGTKGFVLLPKRWVVERSLAWLGNSRRLSKDYERDPKTSESFINIAMSKLLLKRI